MKKLIANVKNWFVHLISVDNCVVNRILHFITNTNPYLLGSIVVFSYYIGTVINKKMPFPKFDFFYLLFACIFFIAFLSVRHFEKEMKEIHRLMAGDRNLQLINDKIYRLRYSTLNLLIPPIAGAFFGVLALILVNINVKTLSAFYLILMYVLCVLTSFMGYLQYIYLYVYIKKLANNTKIITLYNKDYPANTKWIILLTKLYSNYRNVFFVLGLAYVFGVIYFVLCGDYKVIERIISNEMYQIPLVLFWGSVFGAIVVFFPFSSVHEYVNIKQIVDNLKNQTIVDLNRQIPSHYVNHEAKIQKSRLVIAILDTPDYPIRDKLGIVFSAFITCINLAASIVAILEYSMV